MGQEVVPQQVPSTQLPLAHANPLVQSLPFGFFWQVPPTQLLPPPVGGAMALQSALEVEQEVLQPLVVASHWKLPHETAEGVTQVPVPLHAGAGMYESDSVAVPVPKVPDTPGPQAADPQIKPALANWQLLLPSHLPVLPQTLEVVAQVVVLRGFPPAAMLEHVPALPVSVQLWQPPVQALLQHTPSGEQKLLVQSVFALHASPFDCLSPHLLVVFKQVSPFAQSALVEQVFRQVGLLALQTYGSHFWVVAAGQAPLPSQFAVAVKVPAAQLAFRHPFEVSQGLQAPAPLQVPELEQSPFVRSLALHRFLGSTPPVGTRVQVPTLPETLQLLHKPPLVASLQAVSQHTPSVQNPLSHLLLAVQAAPLGNRPHDPCTQVLGLMQSLSLRHGILQSAPSQI